MRFVLTLVLSINAFDFMIAESPLVTWDYKTLTSNSDVIAVVTIGESVQHERGETTPKGLVEVRTKVKIVASLINTAAQEVSLIHHILDPEVGTFTRSPMLSFERISEPSNTNPKRDHTQAHFLVFLKKLSSEHDEYVLTSGPWKETMSVSFLRYDYIDERD